MMPDQITHVLLWMISGGNVLLAFLAWMSRLRVFAAAHLVVAAGSAALAALM